MSNNYEPIIYAAIAEDHLLMREGVVLFVETSGDVKFNIKAENGLALINAVEETDIKPNICLLDLQMPVMDGFETLSIIKERWPDMKSIILTSFMDEIYIVRAISMGARGYLSKNTPPKEIKDAIVKVHKGEYYIKNFLDELLSLEQIMETMQIPELNAREVQLLKLSSQEMTWIEISQHLNATVKSIEGSRDVLYRKLNVKSKIGLLLAAIKLGIVKPDSPGIPIV